MSTPPFPANAIGAPCQSVPPDIFFPTKDGHGAATRAKTICRPCGFIDQCLSYALRNKVEGVWGGKTEKERVEIRKQHGITAEPLSFGSGPINAAAIKSMYRRGTKTTDIAERLGLAYETVRLVIRADEARREQEGRPLVADPTSLVNCADCGNSLRQSSLRKHRREHCMARQAVAS